MPNWRFTNWDHHFWKLLTMGWERNNAQEFALRGYWLRYFSVQKAWLNRNILVTSNALSQKKTHNNCFLENYYWLFQSTGCMYTHMYVFVLFSRKILENLVGSNKLHCWIVFYRQSWLILESLNVWHTFIGNLDKTFIVILNLCNY